MSPTRRPRGRIGTTASTAPAMSPAHAELYREWRRLVEAHVRDFETRPEATADEAADEAEEARMVASMDAIGALARRILATPAQTWGDLVPLAEVAFWGSWVGNDPQAPDVHSVMAGGIYSESPLADEALVKLLGAIFAAARPATATTGRATP